MTSLNWNTQLIQKSLNTLRQEVRTPELQRRLSELSAAQNVLEEKLLQEITPCPTSTIKQISDRLPQLNSMTLQQLNSKQFYDPQVLETTMCVTESVFYSDQHHGLGSNELSSRVREYFRNLKQIGDESVEGYALLGSFEEAKKMFIIKAPRSPDMDNLLHEIIIGIYGTNLLRNYIPNYSYIYGGFKCSPPVIDPENKQVVSWCLPTSKPVNYVIYENIDPSVSVRDFLQTATPEQFLQVYLQILYAERLAVKVCDFTHYDLHTGNVLIRKPNLGNFEIPYETPQGTWFLATNFVATIIDYGYSHIKVPQLITPEGKVIRPVSDVGKYGLVEYAVYPTRSWIIHDMYKFLMFCLYDTINSNPAVFAEASKIYTYFNQMEDPRSVLQIQFDSSRFAVPAYVNSTNNSIDDLERHIRRVCNCNFMHPMATLPLLNCQTMCLSSSDVLSQIGADAAIQMPRTIPQFYELYIANDSHLREQYVKEFFPYYAQVMTEHINQIANNYDNIIKLIQNTYIPDINRLEVNQVRTAYMNYAKMYDIRTENNHLLNVGIYVAQLYGDSGSVQIMNEQAKYYMADLKPALLNIRNSLMNIDRVLDRTPAGRDNWYVQGRQVFKYLWQ